MSTSPNPVAELRRLVDDERTRRGLSMAGLAAVLGESPQWLSYKLNGSRAWKPPEVVRLALVLDLEPMALVRAAWPEVAEHDPVPDELRAILRGSTAAQQGQVVDAARRVLAGGAGRSRARDDRIAASGGDATSVRRGAKGQRPRPPG